MGEREWGGGGWGETSKWETNWGRLGVAKRERESEVWEMVLLTELKAEEGGGGGLGMGKKRREYWSTIGGLGVVFFRGAAVFLGVVLFRGAVGVGGGVLFRGAVGVGGYCFGEKRVWGGVLSRGEEGVGGYCLGEKKVWGGHQKWFGERTEARVCLPDEDGMERYT